MSEERTVAPSPKRRQEARERGEVARSPILTAGTGLLASWIGLRVWGPSLGTAWQEVIRTAWSSPGLSPDSGAIADGIREAVLAVAVPMLGILLLPVIAMAACHLAQTGLLFAPSLLIPNPARLWRFRGGGEGLEGIAGGIGRGLWSLGRAALLLGVAGFLLVRDAPAYRSLIALPIDALAEGAMVLLLRLLGAFAMIMVALGGVDFALQWRRHEARLRQTPEQQRQDLIASEGNPAFRARRRSFFRSRNASALEALAGGASWLLLGKRGLTLVIAGGPLPRPIQIRTITRGMQGGPLRSIARAAKLPAVFAPDLAERLASAHEGHPGRPLPPPDATALAAIWPAGQTGPTAAGDGSEGSVS